jgi:2-polyprenyl-3-methyl-5-hydroxy-6-metoxy-1,4-benzoquinol methylase
MNKNGYQEMWDEFAAKKAKGYLTHKYHADNIVGLTGIVRENEIFRFLDLEKTDLLLDVGCASGHQVFRAAPLCKHATGIDVAIDFIKTAEEFAKENNIANVEFACYDGNKLPYSDNFFDKLICSEVIEHVPDEHVFLDDIVRVVKPGGICVFTVPNWNSRGTLYKRLKNCFRPFPFDPINEFSMQAIKDHGDAHVRQFNLKSFSQFVGQHGLEVIYVGGASFIDFPKSGPIMARINKFRFIQLIELGIEAIAARITRSLGRHIVLQARKK